MKPLELRGSSALGPLLHEGTLAQALRDGSLDALAECYDRWHQRVRVLARRLLTDDAAAEDVVQETFVALPRAARAFRGDVALEVFVLAIAVKRARSLMRGTARRRRLHERYAAQPPPLGPHDPETLARRREMADRLAIALAHLPRDQRIAFVLCEVEGLSCAEAGALAGAVEPTIRTRLFYARRRLRDLLEGVLE